MTDTPMDCRTVLIVTDDIIARSTMARCIQLHGYIVIQAGSMLDSLEQIIDSLLLPTLILIDLDMPAMDGRNFLRLLRHRPDKDNPKVIAMTDRPGDEIFEATSIVQKPFKIVELISLINQTRISLQN